MKRILFILIAIITMTMPALSADDLSKLSERKSITFMQAKGDLLRSGLFISQAGLPPEVMQKLDLLQIAIASTGSDYEIARREAHKIIKGMSNDLTSTSSNVNISVWGKQDDNGVYSQVLIGVGTRGQLIYIFMKGKITGADLSYIMSSWS